MKKILTLTLSGFLFLSACSENESQSATESENQKETTTEAQETEEQPTENETDEVTEPEAQETEEDYGENYDEATADVELTVGAEKVYLWEEESTGIKWLSYYAAIFNESDQTVDASNASVTYYDESGEVMAVSTMGIDIHPYVLEPDEFAYVSVHEPAEDFDLSTEVTPEIGIDPMVSNGTVQWLDVEGVKGNNSSTGLNVTGKMTNSGEEKAEEINVVSGVFDENENFLGVLTGGSDVGIQPGSSSGFELFYPPFPDEEAESASVYEAGAYWIKYEE